MRTSRSLGVLSLGLLALSIAAAAQTTAPQAQGPTAVTLPNGDGRDVLIRACNRCHIITAVIGRPRTRDEWTAVVNNMRERGATMDASETTTIVDYLTASFGPGSQAPATGRGGRGVFILSGRVPDGAPVIGQPLETRPAVGAGQKPAFPGQTRANAVRTTTAVIATVVARGLRSPWSLAFLPDGRMLVTEKPGAMRIITSAGAVGEPIAGVPQVAFGGDGGLLDVVLDPAFASNRQIYFTFIEPRQGGVGVSVARARLNGDSTALEGLTIIQRIEPTRPGFTHFGSRLLFDREGRLLVTTGDRFDMDLRPQVQQLDSQLGKVLRLNTDGTPAPGNPFAGRAGALASIWSYGHRNAQGLALHPATGALWSIEHGQAGGDEVNIIRRGVNYGWPTIAYGAEYDLRPIGAGVTAASGMEQPVYYWDPAIGPTSLAFYIGALIPEWRNNLFVASHNGQHVARLVIDGERVVGEERLLLDQQQMMRWVGNGPDGALWVLTDSEDGRLIRLAPPAH